MAFTYRGSYGPMSLAPQYGGQPGGVSIYDDLACTVLTTVYNARSGGATITNPLPTSTDLNEVGHFAGVDVLGNVLFWAAPGQYYLKVNNAVFLIQVSRDWAETGSP